MSGTAFSICMTALIAAAPAAISADSGETCLLKALQERYPAVTAWQIYGLSEQDGAASQKGGIPEVIRLGSRSLIRIGGHSYWYAVKGIQPVLSATHAIAAGRSLARGDVIRSERDVLAAGCEPLTEVADLAGQRATRAIRPQAILCRASIEARPPVAAGDDVVVRYIGEHVVLTANAIAQADGALGESIPLIAPDRRHPFHARVSGEKEVTLHD